MKLNFLIYFFIFINLKSDCLINSIKIQQTNGNSGEIEIKIFYDTQCSDSVRVFKSSIEPYSRNTEFNSKINLVLIAGAKMTYESTDENDVYFKCKHGEDECLGNTFHACAFYKLESSLAYQYIICYMVNIFNFNGNNFDTTQYCGEQLKFDPKSILTCAQSDEGKQFMLTLLKRKNLLKEPIYFSPWAVVNGEHNTNVESMIFDNLTEYACKIINYDSRVKICSSYQMFYGNQDNKKTENKVPQINKKKEFMSKNDAIENKNISQDIKDNNDKIPMPISKKLT